MKPNYPTTCFKGIVHTLKMLGCLNPKFGSNMDKPNVGLKIKKKIQLKVEFFIFKPTFGFVHIWPKFGFKQPSIAPNDVNSVIIYVSSSCSKPEWVSFFCWTQKKILWRMCPNNGHHWLL